MFRQQRTLTSRCSLIWLSFRICSGEPRCRRGGADRPHVQLFGSRVIVEYADRRDGVVWRIDHIVGHETWKITDDRNGALFDPAAPYVDRILRGDKPADLPVQAPTKYEVT